MASTPVRIFSVPGVSTTRLFLTSVGGTGTPAGGGYLNSSEYGGAYLFTVTEALSGQFLYQIQNSATQVLASGLLYIEDTTETFYGYDPTGPSADAPANVQRGLAAQGYSSARATKLDNLDATVTSRQSESDADARYDDLDADIAAVAGDIAALSLSVDVEGALTAQGYTTTRAGYLDYLDAAITTRESEADAATRHTASMTEHGDTQTAISTAQTAITNLPGSIWNYLTSAATTVGSLGKLIVDFLDAAVSSRQSETVASSRHTANMAEHDATQTALGSVTASLSPSDIDDIVEGVWLALEADQTTAGTMGKLLVDTMDASISSRESETSAATRHTELVNEHNATQTAIGDLNDLSSSDVQSALTAQGLTGIRAALLDNLDAAVSTRATPAQVTTALTSQGLTTGRAALLDNLDAAVTTRATPAQVVTSLNDQGLTTTRVAKIDNLDNLSASPPTAAAIADAVLDEALSGHMTAGTAGEALKIARDQSVIAANNTQP